MRSFSRYYPLLFAILPPLHIAAFNPGRTQVTDLIMIVGLILVTFGLIHLMVTSILKPSRRRLAPVLLMMVVACFYSPTFTNGITSRVGTTLLLIGLGGTAATLAWLDRHELALEKLNSVLALTSVLLVGWDTARILTSVISEHRVMASNALVQGLSPLPETRPVRGASGHGPDIYLIVLDEYANSGVLGQQLGFANQQFEDSLRALGFTIPRLIRSNYAHTTLSLASLLNFTQLTALGHDVGPATTDPFLLDYLVMHNRVTRYLKAHGYAVVFLPSEWWPATKHNAEADREIRVWNDGDPRHFLARTELRRHLWTRSLLRVIGSPDMVDPEYLRATFDSLQHLDTGGRPTFVFAHLLLPHTPYVFDAQCHPRTAPDARNLRLYVDQLKCTNRLVLNLVTALVRRRGPPPVILLQGDHGTAMLGFEAAQTIQAVTSAQQRERFGALGAYFLPGGGGRLFVDTLTLVNVFPKVLNFYFDDDLPLEADDLYMSLDRTPYDLVPVDPRRLQ